MWGRSRPQAAFYECVYIRRVVKVGASLALGIAIAFAISRAFGMDDGRYKDVDPQTKAWFESVQSRQGVPCCSVADGHRTAWQAGADGTYQVMIDGKWERVPPEAVILNAHNPTGDSIVWYIKYPDGTLFIRCFVPVDGA